MTQTMKGTETDMDMEDSRTLATRKDHEWKHGLAAMAWHGWGSPVGLGLLVLLLSASAALLRYAFLG
jgi:hypothetical protein